MSKSQLQSVTNEVMKESSKLLMGENVFYINQKGKLERVELTIDDEFLSLRYNEGEENMIVMSINQDCDFLLSFNFGTVCKVLIKDAIFEEDILEIARKHEAQREEDRIEFQRSRG